MHNVLSTVKTDLLMGVIRKTNTFRRRSLGNLLYSFDMAKFKFDVPAALDSATTYSRIKTLLEGENDFKKIDPKVNCTFDEPRHSCNIKGSQFTAALSVKAQDQKTSTVSIEVELPLALSLFKGKIQETIVKNIKKII